MNRHRHKKKRENPREQEGIKDQAKVLVLSRLGLAPVGVILLASPAVGMPGVIPCASSSTSKNPRQHDTPKE
jgi:hypothetical protein